MANERVGSGSCVSCMVCTRVCTYVDMHNIVFLYCMYACCMWYKIMIHVCVYIHILCIYIFVLSAGFSTGVVMRKVGFSDSSV